MFKRRNCNLLDSILDSVSSHRRQSPIQFTFLMPSTRAGIPGLIARPQNKESDYDSDSVFGDQDFDSVVVFTTDGTEDNEIIESEVHNVNEFARQVLEEDRLLNNEVDSTSDISIVSQTAS